MRSKKFEIIVGLFVLLVIIVLGWLTTQMGTFNLKSKGVYTIYAPFNDVAGLDINTKVKVAGVDIGVVRNIGLKGSKAVVNLAIYKKYRIPKDSTAAIKSKSLLGEKFLEIKFGHSKEFLKQGDYILRTESATDVGTLVNNINKVFNQQNRENLSKAIKRINSLGQHFDDAIQENREELKAAIQQANAAMDLLQKMLAQNRSDVRLAIINARASMEKLNKTLNNLYFMTDKVKQGNGTLGKLVNNDELYDRLNDASGSIKNISGKIDNGKGTLGKLVNNDSVYNNLDETLKYIKRYLSRTNRIMVDVSANSEYQFRKQDSKGYISANIYTMPDKFYRIGVVSEKNYKDSENPSRNNDTKMRFIAQIGKKYYNLALRGGIMESTFGVGADYYMLNDKLKFSVDAFDFNHDNDIRDNNAQLKAQLSYTILRHFNIFGGVNEILNSKSRSGFIGAGMEFSDDDLKYLVDKVPTGAIK